MIVFNIAQYFLYFIFYALNNQMYKFNKDRKYNFETDFHISMATLVSHFADRLFYLSTVIYLIVLCVNVLLVG